MEIEQIPLIGGHVALDFVNSLEGRGSEIRLDYLGDYGRLVQWCARLGLISRTQNADLMRRAAERSVVAARVWREAVELREDLNRIARALVGSDVPASPALAAFNETLQQAFANRRLFPSGSGDMRWTWSRTGSGLKVPVWEIALAAADLVTDAARRQRIKICANGPCDWLFLDTSRNGRRRWCRMAVCGNTSKVRRFRERQQSKH